MLIYSTARSIFSYLIFSWPPSRVFTIRFSSHSFTTLFNIATFLFSFFPLFTFFNFCWLLFYYARTLATLRCSPAALLTRLLFLSIAVSVLLSRSSAVDLLQFKRSLNKNFLASFTLSLSPLSLSFSLAENRKTKNTTFHWSFMKFSALSELTGCCSLPRTISNYC